MTYATQKEAMDAAIAYATKIESEHGREATIRDFIKQKEVVAGFLSGMEVDAKGVENYKWFNMRKYPYASREVIHEMTPKD